MVNRADGGGLPPPHGPGDTHTGFTELAFISSFPVKPI